MNPKRFENLRMQDEEIYVRELLLSAHQVPAPSDILIAREENKDSARTLSCVDVNQEVKNEVAVDPVLIHSGEVQLDQPLLLRRDGGGWRQARSPRTTFGGADLLQQLLTIHLTT